MIIDSFKPSNKIMHKTSVVLSSYLAPLENKIITIEAGKTVQDVINQNELEDVVVYKEDVLLSTEYVIKENDVIYVYSIPESGGGGVTDLVKIAVLVAVAVYAPQAYVAMGGTAGTYGAELFMAGAMIGTAYALGKMFPVNPDIPSYGSSLGNDSSTYGWGDTTNKKTEGTVLPLLFGKARIVPPYINAYLETAQDGKQTLHQLFALNFGQVEQIQSIKVNDNNIENYQGCYADVRYGTKDQTPIDDFIKTRQDFSKGNIVLTTDWYQFQTNSGIDNIGLNIAFQGLGAYNDSGGLSNYEVELEAQYSSDGSNWNYFKSYDYIDGYSYFGYNGNSLFCTGYYAVQSLSRRTVINRAYTTVYDYYYPTITINSNFGYSHNQNGVNYYKYTATIKYYYYESDYFGDSPSGSYYAAYTSSTVFSTSSSLGGTIDLSLTGSSQRMYGLVDWLSCTSATQEVRNFYFNSGTIAENQYYVRVRRKTAFDTNIRVMNKALFVSHSESIANLTQRFPSIALLGIRALATDQLNGNLPTISAIVTRYGNDIDKPLSNPAWACRHIVINYLDANVNENKFQEWADYCDNEGYFVNLYIETQIPMRKLIDMIASLGQGYLFEKGYKYWDCRFESYNDAPVQSFIFNDSNIAFNSYNETYLPLDERFNTLELTYFDEDLDYDRNILVMQNDSVDVEKKTSLVLYGCTNRIMAQKLGTIALRKAKYETLTASWSCDIDAIHCGLYDIVYVQHSVPKWNDGSSGLIKEATQNTIKLDQDVTLEAGTSYKIKVQHINTDIVEEFNTIPTLENETTDTLTINGTFDNTPLANSKYTFKEGRFFKIVDISKLDNLSAKITAIEYIPEIYNIGEMVIPFNYYATTQVNNISFRETLIYDKQGNIATCLNVSWSGFRISYNIEIATVNTDGTISKYDFVASTGETSYNIYGLNDGVTYRIKIDGIESENHLLLGKQALPQSVTSLKAQSTAGILTLNWDDNNELDFYKYEILTQGKKYETEFNTISLNDLEYIDSTASVYVVDTSGNKSDASTVSYSHREKSVIDLIADSYLIEKGFQDGVINMYWSEEEPMPQQNYDLWVYKYEDMTIANYSASSSFILDKNALFFESGVQYRYYWNGYWYTCTSEQELVVNRMLRYVTQSSVSDGLVRIFNTEPFAPYEIGDIWIDGETVRVCTTNKEI